MEKATGGGTGARLVAGAKFSSFFYHHERLISEAHTGLHRGVSAAQAPCPPAAVGPKTRVGFSRWDKFRQNYQGSCQK